MAKKILVVDDDRDTRLLLQVILRKDGHEVCAAHDGNEALELVEQEKPDLIIVDAMMPGLDGFATLKALRTRPSTETIPVVMLSAQTENEGVLRAWRDGVDLYIEKPFDPQDLTAYIRRIFQERRAPSDRRCGEARADRRASDRRTDGIELNGLANGDQRGGDRRAGDRRSGDRRLDFVSGELI